MKKYNITLLLLLFFLTACSKNNIMIDLKNKTVEEIKSYSEANNLNLDLKYEYSTLNENTIISQNIKPGTKINNNDKLEIIVSKGINKEELYLKYKVNELGRVPIMMYHGIENKLDSEVSYIGGNVDKNGYNRTKESFIRDLEFYYQNNYRMVRLIDYVNGNINTEIGKSPIILTFDDGNANNIKVTGLDEKGNIIIDPNSAVGILESFKQKYKDFNVTATFFIFKGLFNQKEYNDKIIKWLIDNNYDIGNHSYSHANLKALVDTDIETEIGRMYELLANYTDKYVNIVAVPFGSLNKANIKFSHILNSNYNNKNYQTISTLQVGWESDYSPFSNEFNKESIKRIRAYDNEGKDFDIKYNFDKLEINRYISDGDYKTIVIPKENEDKVKETNLQLITY